MLQLNYVEYALTHSLYNFNTWFYNVLPKFLVYLSIYLSKYRWYVQY